jgi:hypothetical protein
MRRHRLVDLDARAGELATMRDAAEQGTDALLPCAARAAGNSRSTGWLLRPLAHAAGHAAPLRHALLRRADAAAAQEVHADGRETVEHMWLRRPMR